MNFLFQFSLSVAGKTDNYSLPVYELWLLCLVFHVYSIRVLWQVWTIAGKRQCVTVCGTDRESDACFFFLCSADCSKKGNGTLSIKQEVKALILSWLRYRWHKKEYNRIFRQLNHKSLFTRLRIIKFSSMHRHVCETKGYLSTPQETVHQNWKSRKQTVPCSAVTDASYNCLVCLLFLATKNDPNSW